jgi:hypothetical protein
MSARHDSSLFFAPEIIVADLADAALNALEHALRREHPRLDALFANQPPVRRHASAILIHAEHLRAALRAYRRIVTRQRRQAEQDNDLF